MNTRHPYKWSNFLPFDPIIKSGDYRLGDGVMLRPSIEGVSLHAEIRCFLGEHQAIGWFGGTDYAVFDLRDVAIATRHTSHAG